MSILKKILSLVGISAKNPGNNRGKNAKAAVSRPRSDKGKNGRSQPARGSESSRGRRPRENGALGNSRQRARRGDDLREFSPIPQTPIAHAPKEHSQPYSQDQLSEVGPFAALGLTPKTLSAIKDMGYASPTEVQSKAIPVILSGCDVIATAQTGTGKTAAFALPIIELLDVSKGGVQVLVLSPTRELASQTNEAFSKELCFRFRKAIVSTSANISGQPAPAVFSEISEEIKNAVDYVVDFRREENGHPKPSSIIKLGKGGVVKVIRE